MSRKSETIDFAATVRSSKYLVAFALVVSSMALLSIALLAKHYFVAWFLFIPTLLYLMFIVRRDCLGVAPKSIVYIQQIGAHHWRLVDRAGSSSIAKCQFFYRSPLFVILHFSMANTGKKRILTLAFDSLSQDAYRLLVSRLFLKNIQG